VFSATQKIHFFFLLFTSTLKFKRFKENPFAQKPKKYCFNKEDDFPDQQWVAEIEENDVFLLQIEGIRAQPPLVAKTASTSFVLCTNKVYCHPDI
jgi:hypothetical protein